MHLKKCVVISQAEKILILNYCLQLKSDELASQEIT